MRPRYTFETKKPTKSAVYRKPTNFSPWSQNGTKKKFKEKGCLASQRNSLEKHNNNKLKNLTTNNQQNLLLFILHKPVSLIQAIVQPITTVHVNLGVDRLIEALNERIHSLQERRIACSISCYQVACR